MYGTVHVRKKTNKTSLKSCLKFTCNPAQILLDDLSWKDFSQSAKELESWGSVSGLDWWLINLLKSMLNVVRDSVKDVPRSKMVVHGKAMELDERSGTVSLGKSCSSQSLSVSRFVLRYLKWLVPVSF